MHTGDRTSGQVVSANRTDGLAAVERIMKTLQVRHVPVVEKGRLVGIISDRDLLRHAGRGPGAAGFPAHLRADDVMAPTVVTCRAEATLQEIARRMLDRRINALPVVDAHLRVVGIVTSTDILRHVADDSTTGSARAQSANDVMCKYAWDWEMDVPESAI